MQRLAVSIALAVIFASSNVAAAPWRRHTIDDTSRGADGVRLADLNGDGRLDIATGWEEGGQIRVYLHPATAQVKKPWPAVTVGNVRSPEDAVFIDMNGDGVLDVLSSCEGKARAAYVHLAPQRRDQLLSASAWRTSVIPATQVEQQWMYAAPLDVGGRRGMDVMVGSKNKNGSVGWLQAPADRADLNGWRISRVRDAGWIMSLEAADIDGDGDVDVLASDRKGKLRGVFWLENLNPRVRSAGDSPAWDEHRIGGENYEVMFLDYADLDGDHQADVVAAAKPRGVLVFSHGKSPRDRWTNRTIGLDGALGNAKAIRVADLDLDGRSDLVLSCEGAIGEKSGVAWFSRSSNGDEGDHWSMHDISGASGTKFDRIELIDLDADGDLDVVTCEEAENLGVIWYENPLR